jgi:hypothetical protein
MRISIITLALVGSMFNCQKFTQSLNHGLEDEKSYTRHAMETYRKNPNVFHGNKSVLETWSRSDYIALAVAQQKRPRIWAESSDRLTFLDSKLQHDTTERPFCVIHEDDRIVVLSIRSAEFSICSSDLMKGVDIDRINSGDMEFSGRTDYWVYILKLPAGNKTKSDQQSR